jgi:hypothetical protein
MRVQWWARYWLAEVPNIYRWHMERYAVSASHATAEADPCTL